MGTPAYNRTPVLTSHARERCAEMGITTELVKRIIQSADVAYPGRPSAQGPTTIVLSKDYPEYCAVVAGDRLVSAGEAVVVTVLFNTTEYYQRNGTTFVIKNQPIASAEEAS